MSPKNSNAVAVERRMDLASLFCMIGRHGPAVALAVIAMVSVLAGFIIYRTVRGKRRKATAAAADRDSKSPGAERDASVIQPSTEEARSGSAESTDMSDEGSSDVKEDVDPIQSELKIRHRRAAAAAAEKTPPPYSPPKSHTQVPENKQITSDDTQEMAAVLDSHKETETYAEEASQSLQSDTYPVAELVVEDAFDRHQGATDDIIEDVIEEVHDNDSCLVEPETINDENHEEEENVLKAECLEAEDMTADKDVFDKKTKEEEENFQHTLNKPLCFEQTLQTSENGDDDRLQDNKTPLETNSMQSESGEPVIHIEDVPVSCICDEKDESEDENPDSVDHSYSSSNHRLSPEEEKKNEGEEAEVECGDYKLIAQEAEMWSSASEQETNLPSTQQDQCDHVTDMMMPPVRDSDWDEDGGLVGEVVGEVLNEDHLHKHTAVKSDAHSPQSNEQEVEIEQKEDNDLTCSQEDSVLYDGDDEVKEEMLTSDSVVACSEERESSSMSLSTALPSLSAAVKVDNHDDGLSGITTDAKVQISGIADFPNLSLDYQEPQTEDKTSLYLDEDTGSTILGSQMISHETENQPEGNENYTTGVSAEECSDQVCDPHIQSCYKDQQSVQMVRNEASDETNVAAAPDIDACDVDNTPIVTEVIAHPHVSSGYKDQKSVQMVNNEELSAAAAAAAVESVTASVVVEEIPCPPLPSICQDQQSNYRENDGTFDEQIINSATDAAACINASLSALLISEEISHPDVLTSNIDQQIDQTRNNEDFTEVPASSAPVMTEDISPPMCHIHLPPFKESELRDNDMSSPGVGEESGISSMAVSPDLQDAANEFGVIIENMVYPVIDCDLQSEGQAEAKISLFADDVVSSGNNESTGGMVFGPYPSPRSQPTHNEHTDLTKYESFAANEDMFGHEIEDSYHRALDQFTAQIATTVTLVIDEVKKQTDVKAVVEFEESKEKKAGLSVEKKEETKEENEKEEDYEKTEISIMEATMDNNEWITDSNYQVLPWMNLSTPSFSQDHTKTDQLPTKECQYNSAVTDTPCIDTDIPPSTEVKQTSPLSLVDENTENNKKVVAVQPMPQNVNVTFRIHYFTQSPYQTVAVTGDQQELGNWKGFIPLQRVKDGHWATVVSLPAESHVEWKFVVVDKGEVCRWEECGNRLLDTGYGEDLLVHKWWGLL